MYSLIFDLEPNINKYGDPNKVGSHLQYDDCQHEEVDGGGVHPLVYLGGGVREEQVVAVDEVLDDEEEESEGRDEGAGDAVHHRHGEDEHEPRVLLAEAELVLERLPDEGPLRSMLGPVAGSLVRFG